MNEVFLIGKLIEDVEYKFMLQKRKNILKNGRLILEQVQLKCKQAFNF